MPFKNEDDYRDYQRAYQKEWRKNNLAKRKAYEQRPEFKKRAAEIARRKRAELRAKAIKVYGGRCAFCGIEDGRVLQFHHVNGDGAEHRRKTLGGNGRGHKSPTYYREIIAMFGAKPTKISLLCANCHLIVEWESKGD